MGPGKQRLGSYGKYAISRPIFWLVGKSATNCMGNAGRHIMKLKQSTLDAALKAYTEGKPHSLMAVNKQGEPTSTRHSDGRNLYLNVTKTGQMSWVYMWDYNGKRREMGLGSFTGAGKAARVTLAQARLAADAVRFRLSKGEDPFYEKRRKMAAKEDPTSVPTPHKTASFGRRGKDRQSIDDRLAELRFRKPELATFLERQIEALLKSADEALNETLERVQQQPAGAKKGRVGRPRKPLPPHLQRIVERKA